MLVHLHGRYLRAKESDINLWFLTGTVIRLALSKGYHRDPTRISSPNISPYEGEMRRRVWVCLFQADALMSFQMGLPSMIPSRYCDTDLPRNLEYSDFHPETVILPTSRPFSDYTPITYTVVKAPIMAMFKEVVDHTRSLTPPAYNMSATLDKKIREVYDRVPGNFRYKPISESILESPGLVVNRATIEMLYLKSIIVLHRQYLTNRHSHQFQFSRNSCVKAACFIIDRQAELHEATQPGGLLYDERWMVSSLVTHDFILAAMVLCLDITIITRQQGAVENNRIPNSEEDDQNLKACCAAIHTAYTIWAAKGASSSEAYTIIQALRSTIDRLSASQNPQDFLGTSQSSRPSISPIDLPTDTQSTHQGTIPDLTDGMAFVDWVSVPEALFTSCFIISGVLILFCST